LSKVTKTVKNWIAFAHEDLRAAQVLFEVSPDKYLRAVPFHCQQAAEKSIKGYLAYKKIKFPKTHDIEELANLVGSTVSPETLALLKESDFLTDYAVEFRYPESTDAPLTSNDSAQALETAKKIYTTMSSLIPAEDQWDV
jgi:HEPN domain-containing protein